MRYHKILTVLQRDPKTNFRTLIPDVYACPEFEYLRLNRWVLTEKVDGTNIRVMWTTNIGYGQVRFGGKTDKAQLPTFLLDRLQDLFPQEKLLEVFPYEATSDGHGGTNHNVIFFGEGYGAKIQKGGGNYKRDGCDFVLFDVNIDGVWLKRDSIEDIANKLGLDIVPITGAGYDLEQMVDIVKEGFKSHWGDFLAEGVVARPEIEMQNRMGHRIITKLKYKDFRR